MSKKSIKIEKLNEEIEKLNKTLFQYQKQVNDLVGDFVEYQKNIEDRDYLMRTNFKGCLKNKKIIGTLETDGISIIGKNCQPYSYYDLCEQVKNFNFKYVEDLKYMIEKYEEQEHILNCYKDDKETTTKRG